MYSGWAARFTGSLLLLLLTGAQAKSLAAVKCCWDKHGGIFTRKSQVSPVSTIMFSSAWRVGINLLVLTILPPKHKARMP
jgi:hypothetical protein